MALVYIIIIILIPVSYLTSKMNPACLTQVHFTWYILVYVFSICVCMIQNIAYAYMHAYLKEVAE